VRSVSIGLLNYSILNPLSDVNVAGKAKLLGFVSEMLGAALQCISDQEKEIRQ
jgi:hypothetical protein